MFLVYVWDIRQAGESFWKNIVVQNQKQGHTKNEKKIWKLYPRLYKGA